MRNQLPKVRDCDFSASCFYRVTGPVALVLSLSALSISAAAEVTYPSQLILKVNKLSVEDAGIGQKYAMCMRVPSLPLPDDFQQRSKQCAALRSGNSRKLTSIFDWVDHMATQFPGQEIDLKIQPRR